MPGFSSPDLFPLTGGDLSSSTGSSGCSPGSAAGAPLTAWATWTTGPRFGSSPRSTGRLGFTLVIWDLTKAMLNVEGGVEMKRQSRNIWSADQGRLSMIPV
ncbi:hypothetical protein AOLI_G00105830 [Acnodon oligacanthus]